MELIPKKDLIRRQKDKDIVHKTALQVIKDFSQFGYDIQFPEDLYMAYNELFDQLTETVKMLLNENAQKLFSLLYTIDISESSVQRGLREMKDLPVHDALTHLILERELKKVLTREYFSKGNS
jgi:hypothetical protein